MDILAIGSHPDDIEFGCGGTLRKYHLAGHAIHLLVMSDGARGGDAVIRRREQEAAANVLGIRDVRWGDFPDAEIPTGPETIQRIERVIREIQPALIFVHHPDDTHQDHRNVSLATSTATRYVRNLLHYEGPTTQTFLPTIFVDIAPSFEDKIRALEAHASQRNKTNIPDLSATDIARSLAHFRGLQGRVAAAEGFVPIRLFINV
ncbi:MAG: PIG-L deacetylase family protein [Planctomycetota bacterium]